MQEKNKYYRIKANVFFLIMVLPVVKDINYYKLFSEISPLFSIVDKIITFSLLAFVLFSLLYDIIKNTSKLKKDMFTYSYLKENLLVITLITFLFIVILSNTINIRYGFIKNVKELIWMSTYFYVFIILIKNKENKINEQIITFQKIWIILIFLLTFTSIIYSFLFESMKFYVDSRVTPIRFGIVDSRLFGLMVDPNYMSVSIIISILMSINLIQDKINIKKEKKIFFSLNVLVLGTYFSLAKSRTGIVILISLFFVLLIQSIHNKLFRENNRKIALFIIAFIFITSGIKYICNNAVSQVPHVTVDLRTTASLNSSSNLPVQEKVNELILKEPRVKIWKSAVDIFKAKWFLGVSHGNKNSFAKINMPENYLAKRSYNLHNSLLEILVSTGITGFLVFLFFIYQYIKKRNNLGEEISIRNNYYFLVTLVIFISSLFLDEMIFVVRPNTYVFWGALALSISEYSNS